MQKAAEEKGLGVAHYHLSVWYQSGAKVLHWLIFLEKLQLITSLRHRSLEVVAMVTKRCITANKVSFTNSFLYSSCIDWLLLLAIASGFLPPTAASAVDANPASPTPNNNNNNANAVASSLSVMAKQLAAIQAKYDIQISAPAYFRQQDFGSTIRSFPIW